MTTEQKAKAYDEALERAKEYYNVDVDNTLPLYAKGTIEYLFPELQESEGEKVKRVLHSISSKMSTHLRDIFTEEEFQCFDAWSNAWLETQGQVKESLVPQQENKTCEENSNSLTSEDESVEPKFHEGEWVVNKLGNIWHIDSFDAKNYQVTNSKGGHAYFPITLQGRMHLWTIQEAKNGEVLADEENNIGIYKEIYGIYWSSYIFLGCDGKLRGFSFGGQHEQINTHPATKKQRDTLEIAMTNAGYRWNKEELKLEKI